MIDITKRDPTLGKNLPLLLRSRMQRCPDVTLQAVRNRAGMFDHYSYRFVYERVVEFAAALKEFGIKRGDLVALMADNRREWLITDMALLSLGAADVPRGCDSTGAEMRFIINYTGCRTGIFENGHQLSKILEKRDEVPFLKDVILFDAPDQQTDVKAAELGIRVHLFSALEQKGASCSRDAKAAVEAEMDKTEPDEVATVIFTSGTTGTPKGVMLTHDNYMAQCEIVRHVLPDAKEGQLWLSVLPVWHSFERAFVYMIMALNSGYAYSKPVATIMLHDMEAVHPQWMTAVPRLWESFAQGFYREMRKRGGLQLVMFNLFITVGKSYSWAKEHVCGLVCRYHRYPRILDFARGFLPFILLFLPHFAGEVLVYRKVRAKLGGRMIAAISGGGSLQSETDAFYHAIGFKLLEGYGMTETAPVLSVRNSRRPRSGCVGEVFPCVDVMVAAEKDGRIVSMEPLAPGKKGLILARGRQIMKGYYKRPDLTAQIIGRDGWLNTGDLGMMSVDGEIKITGRAKDTIVLLGGENVEPALVEAAVKQSRYVESVCVVGQDRKYIAALIVPQRDAVIAYAAENTVVYETYEALLETSEIQNLIQGEIDRLVCAETGFRTCERIYRFALLPQSFRIGEEINAKQEMMRHKIGLLYEKKIKKLFK